MGAAFAVAVFTRTAVFRPELRHVYTVYNVDNNNNGTFLTIVDETAGFTVLQEWVAAGCEPTPWASRTLEGDLLFEFRCD